MFTVNGASHTSSPLHGQSHVHFQAMKEVTSSTAHMGSASGEVVTWYMHGILAIGMALVCKTMTPTHNSLQIFARLDLQS